MEHGGDGDDLDAKGVDELKSGVSEVAVSVPVLVEIAGDTTKEERCSQVKCDDPEEEVIEPSADKEEDLGEAPRVGASASEPLNGEEVELAAGSEPVPTCQEEPKQPKQRHGQDETKYLEIAALTKKLNQAKKVNADQQTQLQRFYTNEVVLQLTNLTV